MENKIQELTEKIYNEGVERGNAEAERIIAEAQAKAEVILKEAQSGADDILEKVVVVLRS